MNFGSRSENTEQREGAYLINEIWIEMRFEEDVPKCDGYRNVREVEGEMVTMRSVWRG